MSSPLAAALTILVLGAAGALPVLGLVGARVVALPLMPLAGAVLCAVAGGCTIVIDGTLPLWFMLWASLAGALSLVWLARHPARVRDLWAVARKGPRPLTVVAALVVAGATMWTLRTLRVPTVGFDAQAIWILHARWLSHGHSFALAAIRNRFLVLSHPGYPPLVSSVMALAWEVSGTSSDRIAVVITAVLNGCALFVAGWGVFDVARRTVSRSGRWLAVAGIVTAGLAVLVAGGVVGTFATNGYADPLWSLTAVGAVLYGLVVAPSQADLGVAAVLCAVAGLTKVEGIAVAMLLVAVIALRLALGRVRPLPGLVAGTLAVLGALLVWPLLTIVLGVPADPNVSGSRQGSLLNRAHHTLSAMFPHLHVVGGAALCGVAGLFVLRTVRGRLGLGNDLWAWCALVAAVGVLGGAYVFGPGNVELWLATSVNRTTIFVALLAWWIVAVWALCGAAAVLEQ